MVLTMQDSWWTQFTADLLKTGKWNYSKKDVTSLLLTDKKISFYHTWIEQQETIRWNVGGKF